MEGERHMRRAIALSVAMMRADRGGPFGAVIVRDGAVIAEGFNRVTSDNDPTAHAEIVAIRAACAALGTFSLEGCEIYTSCEPCPMCLAAIYWARLDRIFYANSRERRGAYRVRRRPHLPGNPASSRTPGGSDEPDAGGRRGGSVSRMGRKTRQGAVLNGDCA